MARSADPSPASMPAAARSCHRLRIALLLCLSLAPARPAGALEIELFDDLLALTASHELTYGVNISTERASKRVIYRGAIECPVGDRSCGNGGLGSDPNADDNRFAFKRGVTANQFKGSTDLTASWRDFTAFTRLLYFYDFEIMDQRRGRHPATGERIEYSRSALRETGRDLRHLDAHLSWDGYIGDHPVTVRAGDQLINWGQSTFLPGIGLTNPVDLNRLFAPGFALRELFKPVGMLFASFGISDTLNVEAYYQYAWEPLPLPPGGSFFALADYLGAGINGTGQGDVCLDRTRIDASADQGGFCILPQPREQPRDGGQFGLRLTYTAEALNYTQFSLYAIRYHNRLPHFGANRAGLVPNAAPVCDELVAAGLVLPGSGCDQVNPLPALNATAGLKYLPDLWAYGVSWSGNLPGGWSFSGELSLKKDYPVQFALPELVSAAAWIDLDGADFGNDGRPDTTAQTGGLGNSCALRELDQFGTCNGFDVDAALTGAGGDPISGSLYLPRGLRCDPARGERCDTNSTAYDYQASTRGTAAEGFRALDVVQAQFTLIKLWSQVLGGDNLLFVFEGIYARTRKLPGQIQFASTDYRNFFNTARADPGAWGYRLLLQNSYSAIFGSPLRFRPTLIWFHDVNGSNAANQGQFTEGVRNLILDLGFEWDARHALQWHMLYARFMGAPNHNPWIDRDTLTLVVKLSF